MKEIEELIEISRKYGKDSRYVIAGGGNTSYKNAEKLWVKASGCALATITEDGFAVLDRKKLNVISEKNVQQRHGSPRGRGQKRPGGRLHHQRSPSVGRDVDAQRAGS